jgi:hypothetical protein
MDPYIEDPDLWSDFHGALVFALRDRLNVLLPERYFASVDRYVWLHEPDAEERTRRGKPDVFVVGEGPEAASATATATLTAPLVVTLPEIRREGNRYVRILDRQDRRIVTVIELLSPSNKTAGPDRDAYLTKRNESLAAGINVVEIDLLRAGQRTPLGQELPDPTDYYLFVCRASEFPRGGVWPFTVRGPVPPLHVPLRPGDADVQIDLKVEIDSRYDAGRYRQQLSYSVPPPPPRLREADAAWARELLAARPHPNSGSTP